VSAPPAGVPRRTKIELLVRGADEDSFEVREVGSAVAFIQSRPQRLSQETWELAEVASKVAGDRNFILKNTVTDRFLLLTEHEAFLWDQMDGKTSLQEIATAYVLKYGEFDFDIIPNVIRKLQRAQLLTLTPTSRLRQALARNRGRRVVKAMETALTGLERINISSKRVQPLFLRLYRWGGRLLFTKAAVLICLALGVAGLAAGARLWPRLDEIFEGFGAHKFWAIVTVNLFLLVTLAVHQIVHGLATIRYKRRVREFGFTFLHGFVPTFYVDVTDIFMVSRRARVTTAVSGTVVHLVLGSIFCILAWRAALGSFNQAFLAASALIQWKAFVLALWPFSFIEMDGYHVLVDSLGVPSLKSDALAYVGRVMRGRVPRRFRREHALWILYVAVSALSWAGFIGFWILVIFRATH
jgi:putative peptide zinc metalloprotease protein